MLDPDDDREGSARRAVEAWLPSVVRIVALAAIVWETVVEEVDRPYLLATLGALLGANELVQAVRPSSRRTTSRREAAPDEGSP